MENIENVEKRGGRLSAVGCRLSFPLFESATRDHEPVALETCCFATSMRCAARRLEATPRLARRDASRLTVTSRADGHESPPAAGHENLPAVRRSTKRLRDVLDTLGRCHGMFDEWLTRRYRMNRCAMGVPWQMLTRRYRRTAHPAHHCANSASRLPHRVNASKRNRREHSLWATKHTS